jgi:hypothetical protein
MIDGTVENFAEAAASSLDRVKRGRRRQSRALSARS